MTIGCWLQGHKHRKPVDLRKTILKDYSRSTRDAVVSWVGQSPGRFSELVQVFLNGPYRITQRASWPLSVCVEKNPTLVMPHLKRLVSLLEQPDLPVAVKRNIVRLLQFVEIPKPLHGSLAKVCFRFLEDKKETIAVRVFSMTVLVGIARTNGDLMRELKLVVEDQLPYASAAFRNRALKLVKLK